MVFIILFSLHIQKGLLLTVFWPIYKAKKNVVPQIKTINFDCYDDQCVSH